MAKINESVIVIKVSELVRDGAQANPPLSEEVMAQLEEVIQQLAGPSALVEIERG